MFDKSLEDRVNERINFLSSVTGLPITEQTLAPNGFDESSVDSIENPALEIPITYDLILGTEGDQYHLHWEIKFKEWNFGPNLEATVNWYIRYNNSEFYNSGFWSHSSDLSLEDFSDTTKIKNAVLKEINQNLRGVDSEVAFMDYENYTVESLSHDGPHDYFRNIYLLIMCNMKERGLEMPPILSKDSQIRSAMQSGDVETTNILLEEILNDGPYDSRIKAHMYAEAEEIKWNANYIAQRRDPNLNLYEKFTNLQTTKVGGEKTLPSYNILVVENQLPYGYFAAMLSKELEKDGRYGNTNLITEFMLHGCMQLCETGQIDLIIFDWSDPSWWESLMVQRPKNPLYDMYYGDTQAVINFDEKGGMQSSLKDGQIFDEEAMKEESERIDIRSRWYDMIKGHCASANIDAPPYSIIRSEGEFLNLANIVSEKLGNPLS